MRADDTARGRSGPTPAAHLHPQGHPHDEAYVVADEAGLRAIGRAVTQALDAADGIGKAAVFTADGEGYDLIVIRSGREALGAAELPYTEADALDPRPAAVHPAAIYWGLCRPRGDGDPPDRA